MRGREGGREGEREREKSLLTEREEREERCYMGKAMGRDGGVWARLRPSTKGVDVLLKT